MTIISGLKVDSHSLDTVMHNSAVGSQNEIEQYRVSMNSPPKQPSVFSKTLPQGAFSFVRDKIMREYVVILK